MVIPMLPQDFTIQIQLYFEIIKVQIPTIVHSTDFCELFGRHTFSEFSETVTLI